MITVSLCMIVKNEEETLERCLSSVADLVDEIIIVDTGSTDRTKEIARSFNAQIHDFTWINDFAAARNYSYSKATMDYQLWLDADDILLEKDRIAFKKLKDTLSPDTDMVLMQYNYHVDGNNNPLYYFHRQRLVKRANNYQWNDRVHEFIEWNGNCLMTTIAITHKRVRFEMSDRNLKIYEQQQAEGVPFTPRMLFYYARELRDHNRDQDAIKYFKEFLATGKGIAEDCISACLETGKLYQKSGEPNKALDILFSSFSFDLPKAEIVCEIAKIYQAKKEYKKAIHWFEYILGLSREKESVAFKNQDAVLFTPAIELCVCYFQLGNMDKAIYFNELAATAKPDHPSVLANKRSFEIPAFKELAHFMTQTAK